LAQAITNKLESKQMKLDYDDLIASLWEAGAATASHFSHWLQRRARRSSRIHRNRAGTSRLKDFPRMVAQKRLVFTMGMIGIKRTGYRSQKNSLASS
jgi:hypothetical protein